MIREAVRQGAHLQLLALGGGLDFEARADRVIRLTPRATAMVGATVAPQGVVAIADEPRSDLTSALTRAREGGWPLLVLDAIQDPGNVGAICRTAAAAGAPAVVLLDGSADPFGPKAVRAAAGATFGLTVARATWADLREYSGYGAVAHGGQPPNECDPGAYRSPLPGQRDARPATGRSPSADDPDRTGGGVPQRRGSRRHPALRVSPEASHPMTDTAASRPAEIAAGARAEIAAAPDVATLERLRVVYLGQRSELMAIPGSIRNLPADQRAGAGQAFNAARTAIEAALAERGGSLDEERLAHLADREAIDVTFPGDPPDEGACTC